MVQGIVIPAVNFLPLTPREFDGLADYQAAVQGYIEPLTIYRPRLTLYVNEEGKVRKMSFNERATALWWMLAREVRGEDVVVGDAVLTADESSEEVQRLFELIATDHECQIEVLLRDLPGEWLTSDMRFPTWFEAAKFAIFVAKRLSIIADARIIAA